MLPVILVLCVIYSGYFFIVKFRQCSFINRNKIVLLVTSHPDDECMFFAPTILNLLKEGCEIYLLCLSSGGFCKKGSTRKEELRQSCKVLGIPAGNLFIIEHSQLPDNPDLKWSRLKVSSIILRYVSRLSVNTIVTFDEGGVSGHLNHVAVSDGLKYLSLKKQLPKGCEVYLLKTVFLMEKYLAFAFVPLLYISSSLCFASNIHDIQITWQAMKTHKSQLVWFRKLYIVFSRYVYLNTFIKL